MADQQLLAVPDTLQAYDWRMADPSDAPAVHALFVAIDQADRLSQAGTLDDVRREFEDKWCDPASQWLLAFAPGGELAAIGRFWINPEPEPSQRAPRAYLSGEVHPAQRGRGLGRYLMDWLEPRARARLLQRYGPGPAVLRTWSPAEVPGRVALLERYGYRPIRVFNRMRRNLADPIPPVQLPEGLTLATYRPELSAVLHALHNEAFVDHWEYEPVSAEEWQLFFVGRPTRRPELSFIALAGDEIAGMSLNRVSPEENARQGFSEGWIGAVGVRRAYRRRGIASALITAALHAFRAAGLEYAGLGVDAENLSGALRIYERLGFRVVQRTLNFNKEVELNQ
jgi:mycothiol synthase